MKSQRGIPCAKSCNSRSPKWSAPQPLRQCFSCVSPPFSAEHAKICPDVPCRFTALYKRASRIPLPPVSSSLSSQRTHCCRETFSPEMPSEASTRSYLFASRSLISRFKEDKLIRLLQQTLPLPRFRIYQINHLLHRHTSGICLTPDLSDTSLLLDRIPCRKVL